MNILIDFTQIPRSRTGAGFYAENLVREIIKIIKDGDRIYILLHRDESAILNIIAGAERVVPLFLPFKFLRNRFLLMIYEQTLLPLLLLYHRIDIVHSLHYTTPFWSRSARVVTFHDLTMILWPELHTRARSLIMPIYMRAAWKKADAILFVSNATRNDAERVFPASRKLRFVAPLGVEKKYFSIPTQSAIQMVLDEHSITQPFFIYVGTLEPRKNIVRLIQAFEILASEHATCKLILAGKLGWNYEAILSAIELSPMKSRITLLGYVTEDQKRCLLSASTALVYPSLYEGFGLPLLEAMALSVPVITSKVSSMPEVAGDASLLVDPNSIEEIYGAMKKLLDDEGLLNSYRARGPQRASLFSWSSTASITYQAYEKTFIQSTTK